jgi:hypothetical protein
MPPAHPRTISNNHYLLLQQGSSFCSFLVVTTAMIQRLSRVRRSADKLKLLPDMPQRS